MPTEVTTPPASITTDGTVQSLFTTTTPGVYVLTIDLANLAGGDAISIAGTAKVRAAGAAHNVFAPAAFSGVQAEPNIVQRTMAMVCPQGCTFTIQRTSGTDRAYSYRVDRISSVTVLAEGTLTLDGTQQTLSAQTVNAFYVLCTDHSLQAGGDTVKARLKVTAATGGTVRVVEMVTLTGAQTDAAGNARQQSVCEPSDYSMSASLEKTAGANHNVPWALCQIGT